jgi:hypothetical protein
MSFPHVELPAGLFGLCSGKYDKETGKFVKDSQTNIAKCCMETCKPTVTTCYNLCNNAKKAKKLDDFLYNKCTSYCSEVITSCKDNCQLSTTQGLWGPTDNIYKSINKYGCGKNFYDKLDINCIKKNYDNIINDCNHLCSPTRYDLSCTNHCQFSLNYIIQGPSILFGSNNITEKTDYDTNTINTDIQYSTITPDNNVTYRKLNNSIKLKKNDIKISKRFIKLIIVIIILSLCIIFYFSRKK